MSKILIKNLKEIITMNDNRERLKDSSLLIKDNKIVKIAKNIEEKNVDKVIDGSKYYLFPGLINTHHHFYQTLTRNLPDAQQAELFEWLKYLYPIWANLSPEAVYYSTLLASAELLKTGCTTASDQFYVFPKNQPDNLLDYQFDAAEDIGIRLHACRGSMSLSEKDGGLPPDNVVQTDKEIIDDSLRLIEKYHDSSPFAMKRIVLAPCSPFSVTEDLMIESIKLAREYGVQCHTHLAETKDEEKYVQDRFGMRPLAYMEKLGWIGEDVWYAHGVHLNSKEIKKLAETKTGVAHCPVSNMKLSSGAAEVPEMISLGVPVGLAVDGSASNDSSNMILEMKAAFLMHRLIHGMNSITAEGVLSLATNGGRDILNQPVIGSLEEGKAADMFMISSERLGFAGGLYDPVSAIINTGDSQEVDYTIVNGEIVVENGKLTNVDEKEIISRTNEISKKMIAGS
ncbi:MULTISPECIES: 8-oxoguanine deaminase [unclassified Halanaerobium]|uniref:8-oxoguanine deaminase n=1 Tax=unclassified Halanaerobium TaxID=2641197 RepID=UPI000DF29271|nr:MULTISPECIES: 8-oxoguanine deaminase [unclassified Halanaerobium]RCW50694.1 cytosine/adenosine deaminase-related metal-dependent hydrolase [Halanaerobium sp. MA284_MarDTE_T2]RCW86862.1 cytosine/adenosine deaminase-related metal-dependent hydrolase [Halanaerobium sp. DL-01]